MSLEAIGPLGAAPRVSRVDVPPPAPTATGGASFAASLQRRLDQPRAEIDQVRAEVSSLRNGGALRRLASAAPELPGSQRPSTPAEVAALLARYATGDAADPYGWREMSRQIGDSVVGPGFGAMFERQIQQESGFAPEVVLGNRVSSAGAEGIAQLMPQYYPHVDRRDPAQALRAGAQSMQQYLQTWNGDVRKALASYNAGLARVQSAVSARGGAWESALPQETRDYLAAIVGTTRPAFTPASGFGARPAAALIQAGLTGSLRSLGGLPGPGAR